MPNQLQLAVLNMHPEVTREPAPVDLFSGGVNRITLHRKEHSWFARFSGTDAARIQELFGTTDICTGFLNAADAEEVHAAIARLNPEYLVVVEDL